ncbi:MAG TPA: WG repeat-containing protein [Candidatus Angelobacter sp.]|nr:WG repeat-containing protein [Candidatus Angelobacter sp.]
MNLRLIARIWALLLVFDSALLAQTESDRYPFIKADKLGFIDGSGREVVPAQFSNGGDSTGFSEEIANVGGNGGWGYIDKSGKYTIEPKFWWAHEFSDGFACVQLPGEGMGYGFIDKTGRVLIKGLKTDSMFHEGLAPMLLGGKWGYLGTDMQVAIPPQFDFAHPFYEGMATVEVANKWGYIDKAGRMVIPARYDITMPFKDGLGRVKIFSKREPLVAKIGQEGQTTYNVYLWGFVDKGGVEIIPPKFQAVTFFSEGLAFAMPNDGTRLFGIIDKSGKFLHEPAFEEATEFSESLAAVRAGDKWGYVDHAGNWIIPPGLTHADSFWHGLASVVFGAGLWGYIDKKGSVVWQNRSE